jgi:hypothetical protein
MPIPLENPPFKYDPSKINVNASGNVYTSGTQWFPNLFPPGSIGGDYPGRWGRWGVSSQTVFENGSWKLKRCPTVFIAFVWCAMNPPGTKGICYNATTGQFWDPNSIEYTSRGPYYCDENLFDPKFIGSCVEPIWSDWSPCPESVPYGQMYQATRTLLNKAAVDQAALTCGGCPKYPEREFMDMMGLYKLEMTAVIDTGVAGAVTAEGTLTYNMPGCESDPILKTVRFKTGTRKGAGLEDGNYDVPIGIVGGGGSAFGNLDGRSDSDVRWRTGAGEIKWDGPGGNAAQYPGSPAQVRGEVLIHPDGKNNGTAGCIGLNQHEAFDKNVRGDFLFLTSIGVPVGSMQVTTLPGVTRNVGKALPGGAPNPLYQTTIGAYGTVLKEPAKGIPPKNNLSPYLQQLGAAQEGKLGANQPPDYTGPLFPVNYNRPPLD